MAVNCSPFGPKPQFEISSGVPAVGNKLFFYAAGSVNTKQNTYTDSTGGVANTNPVILDSLGQPTNTQLWFTSGLGYKVVYAPSTDTDPPTSPIWTIDNLRGINDATTTIDQWISGPAPTYISATKFTLVGDQTSIFTVGRRVKTTNTSGTIYSSITASAYGALTTVTIVNDSGILDAGLSAVSYSILSPTNSAVPSVLNTITSINGGQLAGNRRKGTNGDFSVNQRSVSGTVTLAAGVYGHDGWKAGAGGCTYTFATVNNLTTVTITAGTLLQVLEGTKLQSGTHTLSWGGTAQGRWGSGSYAASGVQGTVVGGTNINIEFGTGTLWLVQPEPGTIATSFEFKDDELVLCQRYYENSFLYGTAPAQNIGVGVSESTSMAVRAGANIHRWEITYKVPKRVPPPTITLYNPSAANGEARDINAAADCSSTSVTFTSDKTFLILTTTNAGTAISNRIGVNWEASAEL